MAYLVVKSLHIIGLVAWFAGLFYIFRLYVYHVENADKPEVTKVLAVMERRLHRAITTPAMIFTTVMGSALMVLNQDVLLMKWFYAKCAALVVLFAYHFYAGQVRLKLLDGTCRLTSVQCRFLNEVPTLVLLVTVPLAVIRP